MNVVTIFINLYVNILFSVLFRCAEVLFIWSISCGFIHKD